VYELWRENRVAGTTRWRGCDVCVIFALARSLRPSGAGAVHGPRALRTHGQGVLVAYLPPPPRPLSLCTCSLSLLSPLVCIGSPTVSGMPRSVTPSRRERGL
jgi:hypothetical protein